MKKRTTTDIGRQGEDLAAEWLVVHGYTLVARNYRRPFGEVDIIARQDGCLVFIEVKTRSSVRYGLPAEAVTVRKQKQLSRIAADYLLRNKALDSACRFDVLSVVLTKNTPPEIDVVVNAFEYIE